MKALYFDGRLELREVPVPRPGAGEALIRVRYAGICNTDVEITRGYMGFRGILGHEFVGRVEECEDRTWLGQRVVGEINLACGSCALCQKGLPRHCLNRSVLGIFNKDGVMAQYATLPVKNLHPVPDKVKDRAAVFTEPLAAAFRIIEQNAVTAEDRVAILGDGKLAQLIARVLKGRCQDLLVVGKHEEKLKLLSDRGISIALLEKFKAENSSRFDAVIEATGNPEGFELALKAVRPCGRIVLKSTYRGSININAARAVVDEITIIGSRCGPFDMALNALAAGEVEIDDLISDVFPLADAVRALGVAQAPGMIKILIDCS